MPNQDITSEALQDNMLKREVSIKTESVEGTAVKIEPVEEMSKMDQPPSSNVPSMCPIKDNEGLAGFVSQYGSTNHTNYEHADTSFNVYDHLPLDIKEEKCESDLDDNEGGTSTTPVLVAKGKTLAEDETHTCHVCDKKFNTKRNLQAHIRYHTKDKSDISDVFGEQISKFTQVTYFRIIHALYFRRPNGEKPTGKKPFGEEPTDEKPTGKKPTRKKRTGEKPTDKKPTGEKRYSCNICNMKFKDTKGLSTHSRIHTDLFICDICGKKYNKKYNLLVHIHTHTGDKPYKCDICNYSFVKSYYLKTHKKTHRKPMDVIFAVKSLKKHAI